MITMIKIQVKKRMNEGMIENDKDEVKNSLKLSTISIEKSLRIKYINI